MAPSTSGTAAAEDLRDAAHGFDAVFGDDIVKAKAILGAKETPFHQLGLGTVIFLQAALGLEDGMMVDAAKALTDAEANAKQAYKASPRTSATRFPSGMEWEVLQADAVLLLGLTQALSESYMGYVKCMYSLNSAHGTFTKLFKRAFPNGIDAYTAAHQPGKQPSSLAVHYNSPAASSSTSVSSRSLFGRLTGSAPTSGTATPVVIEPEGPIEDVIFYGSAFGFGLFNLVFSLLPAKIRRLVGLFGFESDRGLGIRALNVAATGKDLTLLTYQGIKLLLAGYQANETELIQQLSTMLTSLEERFPHGSLWLLNRAKLFRYQNDPSRAILVLKDGLGPSRPVKFQQADALLAFELAWDLLSERRYEESAVTWLKMTELNTWSHATYTFLSAGCYLGINTPESIARAEQLFDSLPALLAGRRIGGKDLPTEVYIQKKLDFWKRKQARWSASGSKVTHFAQCIRINPAEELGVFWNTHGRIPKATAVAHIEHFLSLSPPVKTPTPYLSEGLAADDVERADLDTQDELNFRELILGITHRSAGEYAISRPFLNAALQNENLLEGKWLISMAYFELAVLDMVEVQALESRGESTGLRSKWEAAISGASGHLDLAAANLGDTDLSSRLESRIAMLRDELQLKKSMLS